MRSTILALVAVLLLAASPAFAGGGAKGDWELGIYGGYGWLDDYGIFHPKNHFLYGGRIGYFLTRHWSLEFSGQRMSTKTDFDLLGVENVDVHLSALRLNALYNFGGEHFRPFLTAGGGKEKIDVDNYGESCAFGWNAGAGFRLFLSPHWNLRADGRYVSTKVGGQVDERQHNVEATLGLSWVLGGRAKHVEEEHAEQAPPNQPPTVTCAAERSEILPGETVNLHATASDPEGDRLTYAWSATAGHVTGTDASATLDFTGATPPATATVTVRVSDGHGNNASSDCSVRLIAPPARQAEAVSCIAGGFPRNLSRITNVDKACLDDVAQRLGADPRARVIVIGHCDSHEKSTDVAQKRADVVKDYLVKERNIDGSRIETRSAAATKPLDTGTDATAQAHNRRVEVWFMPEGAAEPK